MRTAIISHTDCRKHRMIPDHPECPSRLDAINDRMLAAGLDIALTHLDAPLAEREQLLLAHSESLVKKVESSIPHEGLTDLDGDTWLCPDSLTAAKRAAGSGLLAVDKILAGELDAAFCAVRPPGHHANKDTSSGFCIFNNVAIAARYAQQQGIKRIAILDIDVHHGNGTQDIFVDDLDVLFCSIFQHPFYPNTAIESNEHIINTPMTAGMAGDDFERALLDTWFPKLKQFQPELIFISAGFDAHYEDDMGGLQLVEADYLWFTEQVVSLCEQVDCKGIISMLEGGYNNSALGRSVATHLKALIGL